MCVCGGWVGLLAAPFGVCVVDAGECVFLQAAQEAPACVCEGECV